MKATFTAWLLIIGAACFAAGVAYTFAQLVWWGLRVLIGL